MVEDILHGLAVRQSARGIVFVLTALLLSPLALVCVEQQDQLLLDLFPFFGVRGLLRLGLQLRIAVTMSISLEPFSRQSCWCRAWGGNAGVEACTAQRGWSQDRPGGSSTTTTTRSLVATAAAVIVTTVVASTVAAAAGAAAARGGGDVGHSL